MSGMSNKPYSDPVEDSPELSEKDKNYNEHKSGQEKAEKMPWEVPGPQGLYDPTFESESCGVGFIVAIDGTRSHKMICDAQAMTIRMKHRSACDNTGSGDGAGVTISIPHEFYLKDMASKGVSLPRFGAYATGIIYTDRKTYMDTEHHFERLAKSLSIDVLGWRTVPTNPKILGKGALDSEPLSRQVFLSYPYYYNEDLFSRQIYMLRKRATHEVAKPGQRFYICSLSNRIIIYKGMLTAEQLWLYYIDLICPEVEVYLAVVHMRYSTNTFPAWERSHPFRLISHNGEINTLKANVNNMKAREGFMKSDIFGRDLKLLYPVVEPDVSDSGAFDCVLEFLTMAGQRSLPEAVITMVPEAWQNDETMPSEKRDYYRWAACVMEPWDGPALIIFTDGRYIGAILDRNGLRPARYQLINENILVLSSEVGTYDVKISDVTLKGRVVPGKMLLVDIENHKIIPDEELKLCIANCRPHSEWVERMIPLDDFMQADIETFGYFEDDPQTLSLEEEEKQLDYKLSLFGYSTDCINTLFLPMFIDRQEAIGSMGHDSALIAFSEFQPLPYHYFKQIFAQVTNPPIDPFREKIIMSLLAPIGPEANLLKPSSEQANRIWLPTPILKLNELDVLRRTKHRGWKTKVLDITFPFADGADGYVNCLKKLYVLGEKAAQGGHEFLIISDKDVGNGRVAISALLALGTLHKYLIDRRLRSKVALIVETAEACLVHHICVLLSYGADAICPYLAFNLGHFLRANGTLTEAATDQEVYDSYIIAIMKGISIVMAKMGISTLQSYKCGQMFEILGLGDDIVERCFSGTPTRMGGINFHMLAKDVLDRCEITCGNISPDKRILRNSGRYHWRNGGEPHLNCPITIASLQDAAQNNNKIAYETFKESHIESIRKCSLRGQLEINYGETKVNICDVESARKIITRFSSGSMSLGSISVEVHRTLTIGMNRIGARSNAGEGGEQLDSTIASDPTVNSRTSIKQIASARFGVSAAALANAETIQIKVAQGANPGEGSELPAYKVTAEIAAVRRSIPGVGSISPPPHHDVYSIEDLAQLVYDLRCVSPKAKIAIKLVAEVGVGIVATGVVKGNIEHITICGHEGGTGAAYWTGIKSAGIPWELGIAEAHQTLVLNNVRARTIIQAEGNMRTGFDIVVAAILGADEFGFGTIPLIAMGCTMMRKCHLNTCPVGIATQDPVLRKKFAGKPEHVINYFFMLAEDIRQIMANLGITKFQDLIGRTDLLKVRQNLTERAAALDLSLLLQNALDLRPGTNIVGGSEKVHVEMATRLDFDILPKIQPVINGTLDVITVAARINNTDRTFGASISYHIASKFGEDGLPDGRNIYINLEGSAGQSFGAFLVKGVTVTLKGEANDYVGKSLSGGTIIITTPDDINYESHLSVIAGNVCLYGASKGKAFFRGIVADRFCVRNTGATAIVEGVGDHGCEYMTGGLVVILGMTGRNFAAGMVGGIAYVYDVDGNLAGRVNDETVHLVPLEEDDDIDTLQILLNEFSEKTGSVIAQNIIENWPEYQEQFVKVYPYEYDKALSASRLELGQSKQYKRTVGDLTTDMSKHSIAVSTKPEEQEPSVNMSKLEGRAKFEPSIKDIEDIIESDLDTSIIDKVLDKRRGFIKYKREPFCYREPAKRLEDWDEIFNIRHVRKNIRVQSARCMDCGVPFCQTSTYGCPLGNIIPTWTDLVFQSSWKEALNQLLQTNNFPEFTGRVCPKPCEDACVLSISAPPVTIKNIERSIIEHAFDNDWIKPEIPKERTYKNVAIIGSGPAGLAAAHQLNKAGHFVTVYERSDRIGGLLQYGIPSMKLSKYIVKRRVDLLRAEGIKFKTSVYVGKQIEADCFLREYDAVLLAIGCTIPRNLPIPNRDLNGIHFAMEFLVAQQRQNSGGDPPVSIHAKDKDVIIIGDNGLAGSDCMATALRQGAKSIISFEILPKPPDTRDKHNPWPQPPRVFRVEYGHEEAKTRFGNDPREYSTSAKEFVGEDGQVTGVNTIQVKWIEQREDDWILEEIPGTEKCYPADLVILAMGFVGPERSIINELGLSLDDNGSITTIDDHYKTSFSKVFAAGDCRRGQSMVVWAIAEGREAAREIDSYLMGRPSGLPGPGGLFDPTKWLETIPKIPQNKMPKFTIKRKPDVCGATCTINDGVDAVFDCCN